jgi:hypothetical protein
MANTATRWHDILKALVGGMQDRTGFRPPTARTSGIPVFHSIEVGLSSDKVRSYLVMGWAGDPGELNDSGRLTQQVATLGTLRHRQEEGSVNCVACYQSGDIDAAAAFDGAFAIVDEVDTFLRADPSLGLAGQSVVAYLDAITSIAPGLDGGVFVEVGFDVKFSARV